MSAGVLEVPAFVIGLSGIAALADKAMAIWRGLAETREFGNDMGAITAKISMEHYRFHTWAKASGLIQELEKVPQVSTQQTQAEEAMLGASGAPVENAVA